MKKKKEKEEFCHKCQLERGGKMPKWNNVVTMSEGICSRCKLKTTLVPNDDYDWSNKKVIFD